MSLIKVWDSPFVTYLECKLAFTKSGKNDFDLIFHPKNPEKYLVLSVLQ